MLDNYIRAFFKVNGITHPDDILTSMFMEIMIQELAIAEWIGKQKQPLLMQVLARAAEKIADKEKEAAAKESANAKNGDRYIYGMSL